MFNGYFYTHLPSFGKKHTGQTHISPYGYDKKYFRYDTFMKLSDYNALRSMLGYEAVSLLDNQYLLQIKQRIVPDYAAAEMNAYYSQLAVTTKQPTTKELANQLPDDNLEGGIEAVGTDLITYTGNVFLKSVAIPDMKSTLILFYFPLVYIGLVFLCVALTVLSVQQLSNLPKYRYRYAVLNKLGTNTKEMSHILFKQQALFYLCPVILATMFSAVIIHAVSRKFIIYTGIQTVPIQYFATSVIFF